MKVTIIIPVRHDSRVSSAVCRVRAFASRFRLEAEVITCGELIPGTRPSADRHVFVRPAKKGSCIRAGVLSSRGSAILVLDSDVPVNDQDLFTVLKTTATADLVIAKRGGHARRPLARRIASAGHNYILRRLFGTAGLDVQSGVKAFTSPVGRRLFSAQTVTGLAYDVELVLKALDEGLRIEQVPAEASHEGTTISLWKAIPSMLFELLLLFVRRRWDARMALLTRGVV